MTTPLQTLLIGVDGSPATAGAVLAATSEARRLAASLRLVHVVPDRHPLAPLNPSVGEELAAAGASLLKRTAADVAALAPDLEVSTQLRHGGIATQLAAAGDDAAALYVGRDSRPLLKRVTPGNAGAGTAARASCPVVSVPADWDPEPTRGDVVVAVKTTAGSSELLADAFAEAHARGARVAVLHSWRLPSGYDDIIVARVGPAEPTRRSSVALEVLLSEWRTSYPDVEVDLRVVHDEPVHALVTASRAADLLVLARRAHGLKRGLLGGTGRAVLRAAVCPVRVIPPAGVSTWVSA